MKKLFESNGNNDDDDNNDNDNDIDALHSKHSASKTFFDCVDVSVTSKKFIPIFKVFLMYRLKVVIVASQRRTLK